MNFIQRLSWPVTFIIPMVLAMVVALVGLNQPQLPRLIFVGGFIFMLVILPGILIALKIFSAPPQTVDVVLESIEAGGHVSLRLPDGSSQSFQAPALNRDVVMGKMTEGEKLRVMVRGDIVFKWERVSHDVDYWPE